MESEINKCWEMLEQATGISNIKNCFSAYGWFKTNEITISKDDHWYGWWNDCYSFVTIWTKDRSLSAKIKKIFAEAGWTIDEGIINGGFSLSYKTMTPEESHKKAYSNLMSGGRMSD